MAAVVAASPAAARDLFGAVGGYVVPLGQTADFTSSGYAIEMRWRHLNRGSSAFEVEFGYSDVGLDGSILSTIDSLTALARSKNQLAQLQGGPGDGWVVAEYGTLEIFYVGANYLFFPFKNSRVSPFASFGGGFYNWRLPFRIRFYRTPFFGEQHAYDPPAEGGFYSGVIPEESIDYTKHQNTGGLSLATGATMRLTRTLELAATVRAHLIFSNGEGNREEGADNQDYLDNMTFLLLKGGLNWRF